MTRDAQTQQLPRPGGLDLVRAEWGGDREVEGELRTVRGFLAHAIATIGFLSPPVTPGGLCFVRRY
jgi:hypothetical protein